MQSSKVCNKCLQQKPLTEFYRANTQSGFERRCKSCKIKLTTTYRRKEENIAPLKSNKLLRLYGITLVEYESMRLTQNNKCLICKSEFIKTPVVDHHHTKGHVRGLLCSNCNTSIGLVYENIDTLKNMITYLEEDNARV